MTDPASIVQQVPSPSTSTDQLTDADLEPVSVSFKVPRFVIQRFDNTAARSCLTRSEALRHLVVQYLDQRQ